MKKEEIEEFFGRLNKLGPGERTALKRAIGTMIQNADGGAITAYYRCVPQNWQISRQNEEKCFGIACLSCMWDPGDETGKPLEEIISSLIRGEILSASTSHRVQILMDTRWDQDGYMLSKLARLVKLIWQKSDRTRIDFPALLKDLIFWDVESQYVQRKWAKAIFAYQKPGEMEE